ncbi:MAG: MoaD/ThiS family protein [Rhodothermales bacterium]|nr:MoaD/ThiS family protein [Rhodothermales bacterium]
MPPLRLRLQLFSVLRERLGREVLDVEVPAGSAGGDLLDILARTYPDIAAYRSTIRLAINEAYERETYRLSPGDDVALITPVSGG